MVKSQFMYSHNRPALILFAIYLKRSKALHTVLHRHETWSQDLPVENRFSKCENKPLMKIIGSGRRGRKRKLERKLYKKQLHNLYFSSNIIKVNKQKMDKMRWHAAHQGEWEINGTITFVQSQSEHNFYTIFPEIYKFLSAQQNFPHVFIVLHFIIIV